VNGRRARVGYAGARGEAEIEQTGEAIMRNSYTKPRRSILALCLVGLAALLFVSGCASTVTPIKTLLDDAHRFDGEDVRIVGDVESPVGALGRGTYRMNDGTGTLRVVSESGGAPRTGAHVGVEGKFFSAFTIGREAVAALVERGRFTP
jgi:hypothetical protein